MARCAICGKVAQSGLVVDKKCLDRVIILPVPIGSKVYMPYRYPELDSTVDEGVEELILTGYVKEGDREFYIMSVDGKSTDDILCNELFTTYEEAAKALEGLE